MSIDQANVANEIRFPVRDLVQRLGFLTAARNLRGLFRRDVANWIRKGCPSPAPNIIKMNVVRSYVLSSGAKSFVETGTYLGSMVEFIAATGVQCHTIEISPPIYERAQKILARHNNIRLHLGDSGKLVPEILSVLDHGAVFWLDAHYSGSFTGQAELASPVSAELDAILAHPVKKHVILIDDARDFTGEDGYPKLSALLAHLDGNPDYKAMVSADIIRIVPRH